MYEPENVNEPVLGTSVVCVTDNEVLLIHINTAAYDLVPEGFVWLVKFSDSQLRHFVRIETRLGYLIVYFALSNYPRCNILMRLLQVAN